MLLPPLSRAPAYLLAWALAQAAVILGALATALASAAKRLASLTAKPAERRSSTTHPRQPAAGSCLRSTDGAAGLADNVSLASAARSLEQLAEPGTSAAEGKAKAAFLQRGGGDYGYGGAVDALRRDGLARLRGRVYVDHAGAALYSEEQLRAAAQVSLRPAASHGMPCYLRRLLMGRCSLGLGEFDRYLCLECCSRGRQDDFLNPSQPALARQACLDGSNNSDRYCCLVTALQLCGLTVHCVGTCTGVLTTRRGQGHE